MRHLCNALTNDAGVCTISTEAHCRILNFRKKIIIQKMLQIKFIFIFNQLLYVAMKKTKWHIFTIVWPCIVTDSVWMKPTDALNSSFISITTLHVLGSLSAYHTPGSTRSSQLHKMYQSRWTPKSSWWWTERLPKTCRVIMPIKLEFCTSVGFIHTVNDTSFQCNYCQRMRCVLPMTILLTQSNVELYSVVIYWFLGQ